MNPVKLLWLLFLNFSSVVLSEDDFHIDQFKSQHLQRLWGIPDTTTEIGHLFHYEIPKNAFYGNVARFKAYSDDGSPLPNWLIFREKTGVMEGVPTNEDLGEHYIMVKAFDEDFHGFVKDVFALEVLSKADFRHRISNDCNEKMTFSIILDADDEILTPLKRINLIKALSEHFKIIADSIYLASLKGSDKLLNSDILNAGPGDVKRIKLNSSSSLNFEVGCDDNIWSKYIVLLDEISTSSLNGSLAKILKEPIIGWKLWKEKKNLYRSKREVNNLIQQIDGNEEFDTGIPDHRPVVQNFATPKFTPDPSETTATEATYHHHRHNHGLHPHAHNTAMDSNMMPTPTYIPNRPSSITLEEYERNNSPSVPYDEITSSSDIILDPEQKNEKEVTDYFTSSSPTPPLSNLPALEEPTPSSYNPKNLPPVINHRLQKIAVTAGKVLRHKIPSDTFSDTEDGDTKKLKLKLRMSGSEIPPDYWIQLDEKSQEIYALPLEDHISKWTFDLIAYDSGGLMVEDNIEVRVQDHKGRRAVNHAITMELLSVPSGISLDWELELLDAIRKKLNDQDASNITVLDVSTYPPYNFTWTNDSLPRNECPLNEINHLYKILTNDDGLKNTEVFPGLSIGNISYIGKGLCESKPPDVSSKNNSAPIARNPVDYLNATVGQLLVFTVPSDSFFDHQDGNARNLNLTLEMKDGKPIPDNNWLQFDTKNQEFYGIPMPSDAGQREYLLICQDKGGLVARDGLVVIVHPAPRVMYNVEFSMKLDLNYKKFTESPSLQRSFVEKLARLFGDSDTSAIVLSGFSPGSTIITWHNKTLPTNICPDNKIKQLRQIILGDDERLTSNVARVMGEEFPVQSARLTPAGLCQGALIKIPADSVEILTNNDVTAVSHNEHFIIGLIVPAVVITVMLLCAGIIACILYRRRRTGKMSVGDEDERQTFRSKGIPVIFQDELDERPEPTNKSPVIMKEEKPPLPPPEYQRGPPLATTALLSDTEDSPYQPPPPFTASRDSARPKPTPTYRMPDRKSVV